MSAVEIPTLETERLVLRAPGPQDLDAYAAFYASERSCIVGGPLDRAEVWRRLAWLLGHWALRGYGRWAVMTRGTGETLGIVGLNFPEGWPEPEIAWTVFQPAEGRGIAYEAAQASRAHAYRALGWSTAVSLIAPGNVRSEALARRLGARPDGTWEHPRAGPLAIWRQPGPEALHGAPR